MTPTILFLGSIFLNGDLYVCQEPLTIPKSEKLEVYYNYEIQNDDVLIEKPGLYMFKEKTGKSHYLYYYQKDGYIFEELPVKIDQGKYYYKQPLEGYVISQTQKEDLELVCVVNEYYLYKKIINNDGWDENYYLDQTPPEVYLRSGGKRIEGNQLKTNQPFEMVVEDGEKIKVETYDLEDGSHQIPYHFKDELGNETKGVMEVEVDKTKPWLSLPSKDQLYLNQPYTLTISEPHLDREKSYLYLDKQALDLTHPTLQASGMLKAHLEDTFGNSHDYHIEIIYDCTPPSYHLDIKHNKLSLIIDEPLKTKSIALNDISIDENELTLAEGNYHLKGSIEDRCGNVTSIDEYFRIDLNPPTMVYPNLDKQRFNTALPYIVRFEDRFLNHYELNLYLDDQCIKTYQGTSNETIELVLEDTQGLSTYRIEGKADDGLHQCQFTQTVIIDSFLKPVTYHINGADGAKVQNITLLADTNFYTQCDEGTILYQLYKQDVLIGESKDPKFTIFEDKQPTHLMITVRDESGHQTQKIIYFDYPTFNEVVKSPEPTPTPPKSEPKQETTVTPLPLKVVEKKKQSGLIYPLIGVILCALFICMLKRKANHLTHPSQPSEPISDSGSNDTVLCDRDDTIYLSQEDTTLLQDKDQS